MQLNTQAATYDEVGNTLSLNNGQQNFVYNAAGRLSEYHNQTRIQAEYLYNGTGERVVKALHNKKGINFTYHFHYDLQGQLLSETKYDRRGRKRETQEYVWLGNRPIAQLKTRYNAKERFIDQVWSYIHTDHLNSPIQATNRQQTTVWEWTPDAFGHGQAETNPDGDRTHIAIPLRFAGQYEDSESGLYYNYYRYYHPELGRYITSDPIGLAGGVSTYGYVGQNPVVHVDPLGLLAWRDLAPAYHSVAGFADFVLNHQDQIQSPAWDFLAKDAIDTVNHLGDGDFGSASVSLLLAVAKPVKACKMVTKGGGNYIPAPKNIEGIPGLSQAKPKTPVVMVKKTCRVSKPL